MSNNINNVVSPVSPDTVITPDNRVIRLTGSYVQNQRHASVTNRYNPIQASGVGDAMQRQGLQLVSLSTGKARHSDKADFQRTLSRYRGPEICQDGGKPVFLDVIYDSKKMGRGVDKIMLGIYRMICTNGLFVGMNFFKYFIRHSGETYENLDQGIAAALGMQKQLTEMISKMQAIQLTDSQRETLAIEAAKLLVPASAIEVNHKHLLTVHRDADKPQNLWTAYNAIQENSVKGGVSYQLKGLDIVGREVVRNMTTRKIRPNTGKDADFNTAFFEAAIKLAA